MDQTAWRRAKEVLADALDQPTACRDEFVQHRCSAPEELAEVRMLLREDQAAPGFLEDPPSVLDALASVETNDPRLAEALQVFGVYGCRFAELSFDALQALVSETHLSDNHAGERVITQGEKGDCVLIILRGTAIARVRDAPADRVPVGEFGPGDIVGEMSLVTDEPRTADVVAGSGVGPWCCRPRRSTASPSGIPKCGYCSHTSWPIGWAGRPMTGSAARISAGIASPAASAAAAWAWSMKRENVRQTRSWLSR